MLPGADVAHIVNPAQTFCKKKMRVLENHKRHKCFDLSKSHNRRLCSGYHDDADCVSVSWGASPKHNNGNGNERNKANHCYRPSTYQTELCRNRNCLLDSIDACAFAHMHMFPKQRAGVSREEYELNVVRHLDKTMLPNIMKKLEDDLRGLSGLSATCLPCKEDTDEAIAAIKVQPKPPQKPKAAVPEGEATAERTANACAFSLFSSPAA